MKSDLMLISTRYNHMTMDNAVSEARRVRRVRRDRQRPVSDV